MIAIGVALIGVVAFLVTHLPHSGQTISTAAQAQFQGQNFVVTLVGPEEVPVAGSHIVYNIDGLHHNVPLSEFNAQFSTPGVWGVGESLCLAGVSAGCNQPAGIVGSMTLYTAQQLVVNLTPITYGGSTTGATSTASTSGTTSSATSSTPPNNNPCQGPPALASYSYLVNGVPRAALQDGSGTYAHQGDHVTVSFTTTGCGSQQFSFVAYKATSDFNLPSQTVFTSQTGNFSAGQGTLSVTVPTCYFQLDFVSGGVIYNLNPNVNPPVTYHGQSRWIDGLQSGSNAC